MSSSCSAVWFPADHALLQAWAVGAGGETTPQRGGGDEGGRNRSPCKPPRAGSATGGGEGGEHQDQDHGLEVSLSRFVVGRRSVHALSDLSPLLTPPPGEEMTKRAGAGGG